MQCCALNAVEFHPERAVISIDSLDTMYVAQYREVCLSALDLHQAPFVRLNGVVSVPLTNADVGRVMSRNHTE